MVLGQTSHVPFRLIALRRLHLHPRLMSAATPILYVHYGEDWIRGSERSLLDLLAHLDRSRFLPVVWSNSPALLEALAPLGLPTHRSAFSILLDYDAPRFAFHRSLGLVRTGLRLVRKHGIRLVHANSGAPNQWMVPVARTARIPIVAHLHTVYDLRERCTLGLHQVSRAVGVSHAVLQGLLDDGMRRERTEVIYNGLDLSRLRRGDARRLRADLGIPSSAIVVAAVGSLIHRKGLDILLRAMNSLRDDPADIRLLIVGEGPERRSLQELASRLGVAEVTHFLGLREDVAAIYRDAADIATLASRRESFGLSLAEAGAVGIPAVATNVDGIPEVLVDEVTGLLVPSEDQVALAAALRRLAHDPALRQRLGRAALERVHELFTIERNVAAFEQTYGDLLVRPTASFGWRGKWTRTGAYAAMARSVFANLARRRRGQTEKSAPTL